MAIHPDNFDHATDPQLWFRPSGRLSKDALVALLECGTMTATPRLGIRDRTHAKGYYPGQKVTVRIFGEQDEEEFARPARITKLVPRRLRDLTSDDLHDARPYENWHEVRDDLSRFENRTLSPDEEVTVVHFTF